MPSRASDISEEKSAAERARGEREAVLRDTRRRLILEGAWRVFMRDGLEGATMRAIATAAGCTTGAIYPLFPSKEEIYAALLAESLDRLRAAVGAALAQDAPAANRFTAGTRAFLDYYRNRPDEVALGLYLWNGVKPRGLSRELDDDLNERLGGTLTLLEQTLSDLSGLDSDAARIEVAALFAFLIGTLVTHQTGRLRTLGAGLEAIADVHLKALVARLTQ